jgi:hypothetical protein
LTLRGLLVYPKKKEEKGEGVGGGEEKRGRMKK